MRAHFSKAIKNHKTGDYGTERLARCYQLLARYHQHKVCLFGIQCFGYPMPLLLTPMAVEEYGIDVLFCAYSLVVVTVRCVLRGCYGDIQ